MPYFNHFMAYSINHSMAQSSKQVSTTKGEESTSASRLTRSMPGHRHKGDDIYRHTDLVVADRYQLQMPQRKMLFMRSLLRAQVSQILACMGAIPADAHRKVFAAYKMNPNAVLHDSAQVRILETKSQLAPTTAMAARIYPKSESTSMHLKILRHLGRKHSHIVHTWDIFHDSDKVYVFQEWATAGNLVEYLELCSPLSERHAAVWAKQLYRALDFLGDQAIAHRDLSPIHLVVQPQGNEVWLKLTGFKQAIIYWDSATNDVQFCQCWPLDKQATDGPNFQPNEVYGDPETEQFDPILADIWSYGANIYYMLVKQYPYNLMDPYESLDEEIWHNIVRSKLSDDCKSFLFALMRMNANDRMPFDFIEGHPWMRTNSALIAQKGIITSKHQVAGKSSKMVKQPRVITPADMKNETKPSKSQSESPSKCCLAKTKTKADLASKAKSGAKADLRVMRCWCKSKKGKPAECRYSTIIMAGTLASGPFIPETSFSGKEAKENLAAPEKVAKSVKSGGKECSKTA